MNGEKQGCSVALIAGLMHDGVGIKNILNEQEGEKKKADRAKMIRKARQRMEQEAKQGDHMII